MSQKKQRFHLFPNLTLKTRFIYLNVFVIATCLALVLIVYKSIDDMHHLGLIRTNLLQLKADILIFRKHEKDFLVRRELKYRDRFQLHQQKVQIDGKLLAQKLTEYHFKREHVQGVDEIIDFINNYCTAFYKLTKNAEILGLDPESGLRGKLRGNVHDTEDLLNELDQVALSRDMLMLRRHEKDFMLRKDLKYKNRFIKIITAFLESPLLDDLPEGSKDQITQYMNAYQLGFMNYINGVQIEGLDEKSGLMGEIRNIIHQVDPMVTKVQDELTQAIASKEKLLKILAMLFGCIASVAMTIFIVTISIGTNRKVKMITTTVQKIAETNDLSLKIDIESKDEFGIIASSINHVFEELQKLIRLTIDKSREVTLFGHQLGENSKELRKSSSDISDRSNTVSRSADEASQNFQSITASIEEMSINSATIASSIEEMSNSLNEVSRSCERELEIAAHAKTQSEQTNSMMKRLHDVIGNITTVTDTIKAISDQTNLLALNATIEAASAGEAGKGFAVVANEVKELSKQTASAITHIDENVREIKTVADDFIQSFENISEVIEDFNTTSQLIVVAVTEQSITMNEISKNVEQANVATNEITHNVTNTAEHINEVTQNMGSVNERLQGSVTNIEAIDAKINDLNVIAAELEMSVKHFHI